MKKINAICLILSISFLSYNFQIISQSSEQKQKLVKIAKEYKSFKQSKSGRIVVTDSSKYKWTVALCKYQGESVMGFHYEKDSIYFSKVDSMKSLHGNKLYQLYIKDNESYFEFIGLSQPEGQTIVKETWNVEEVDSGLNNSDKIKNPKNGKWFVPTNISQLFIMYKEKENKDNDKGWVYGIVDIENGMENMKVLSNGKLSNCISCHQGTKYDRIFGKPRN